MDANHTRIKSVYFAQSLLKAFVKHLLPGNICMMHTDPINEIYLKPAQ